MQGRTLIAWLLLTGLAGPVAAQEYRGKVQGIVTDNTEAVVVGAQVVLQSTATGVALNTQTNETGRYIFGFVEPGSYALIVEASGFSKFVQQNIRIPVRADITVNARLAVGTMADSITVTEAPAALAFNSATVDLNLSRQIVQELPVANRNPLALVLLDPAVTNTYGRFNQEGINWAGAGAMFTFAGTRTKQLDMLLDGGSTLIGDFNANNPTKDAVAEIVVQQNTTDAEFGRSAGGIITMVSRTGTNEWHGNIQYTGRNPALNAATDIFSHQASLYRDHFWGASVGNPIRKNKLFIFTSWEGRRNTMPFSLMATMPTDLERRGDFSKSLNFRGQQRTIYDPMTTVFDPARNTATRQPFAGNVVPPPQIDPTAARFMKHIWAPNNPGEDITGLRNYKEIFGVMGKYFAFLNRTDWNASNKLRLYGRISATQSHWDLDDYCLNELEEVNPSATHCLARSDTWGGNTEQRNVTGDAVYTLTPSAVLDVRFSWGRVSSVSSSKTTTLGLQGLSELWGGNNWFTPYTNAEYLPQVRFPAVSIGNLSLGAANYWGRYGYTYNFQPAKITWTHGKHYFKSALEYRRNRFKALWPAFGSIGAPAANTANTFLNPNTSLSGDPYAAFLLGVTSGDFGVSYPAELRENFWAAYVQDDLKLTPRVTLNLGLRWEWNGAPYETNDRLTRTVDLTSPIPEFQAKPPVLPAEVTAMRTAPPVWNGALYFTGANPSGGSQPRTYFDTSKRAFQPRIGLALRVNDKTSVRAGWGRWVLPPDMQQSIYGGTTASGGGIVPVWGFSARTYMLTPLEGKPRAFLNNPFPADNPLIMPSDKSLGRYTQLGDRLSWLYRSYPLLTNDRVSVSASRQFPNQVVVELTYLLNYGRNLSGASRDLTMADPAITYQYKGQTVKTVPNPFYGYLTPDKFPGSLRNQATASLSSLLGPYPQYISLVENNRPGMENRYHGLTVKAQRPFLQGYQFVFAYNYGFETSGEYFNAPDQYADRYTLQDRSDPRHRMTMALIGELPVGRGRRFLAQAHPVLNAIVGGWRADAILRWASGSFLRFGQLYVSGNPVVESPTGQRWFDTSVFKRVPNPTYEARTNPLQYPGLTGPPRRDLDATLGKEFSMTEKWKLQFRIEAYNMTNSVMWGNPNTNVDNAYFGKINSQSNMGRVMQYTARIEF